MDPLVSSEAQNRSDLWMFIPLSMTIVAFDPPLYIPWNSINTK